MNARHKFAKEIIHWAEGGEIQTRARDTLNHDRKSDWTNCTSVNPNFLVNEWRIKPKEFQYRVALMKIGSGNFYTATAENNDVVKLHETSPFFVEWITEWQKVKI